MSFDYIDQTILKKVDSNGALTVAPMIVSEAPVHSVKGTKLTISTNNEVSITLPNYSASISFKADIDLHWSLTANAITTETYGSSPFNICFLESGDIAELTLSTEINKLYFAPANSGETGTVHFWIGD